MQKALVLCILLLNFMLQSRAQELATLVIKTKSQTQTEPLWANYRLDFQAAGVVDCERFFWEAPEGHRLGSLDRLFILKVQDLQLAVELSKKWSWIEYAEPQFEHQLLYIPNDSLSGMSRQQLRNLHWGHTNAKVYEAWDISKGDTSLIIGIIDTGVLTTHKSLKSQMAYNWKEKFGLAGIDDDHNGFVDDTLGYDFADWDNDPTQFQEHGTQVAGVAGAIVDDNFGSFGVGFHCKLMPLKIQISRSPGSLRNIYRAMVYAAQNRCKIINLSLGRASFPARYEQEIIDWVVEEYGVLIVAAAGNSGKKENFVPASYRNVLSVVHTDSQDRREQQFNSTTFSPFIDLTAPGVNLFSTSSNMAINQGHRGNITGSSFASPFTAAVGGLIWAKFPNLKAPQVAELIRATTDDTYNLPANKDFREMLGTGRLNAIKALTLRDSVFSLRMVELNLKTPKQTYVSAGDTLRIKPVFVNYLNELKNPLQIKLSTNSSFAQVLDSVVSIDLPVAELDSVNSKNELRIVISQDSPAGQEILLRFRYNYPKGNDYQYHQLFVDRAGFGAVTLNSWTVTQRENGYLSQNNGTLNYNNKSMVKTAGLVLASGNQVSVAFDTLQDFKPLIYADLNEFYDSMISLNSAYIDNKFGIKVSQNTVSYSRDPHRNYLIFEYDIENTSSTLYDTLRFGILSQWNFADSLSVSYSTKSGSLVVSNLTSDSLLATIKTLNLFSQNAIVDNFDKEKLISNIELNQTQTQTKLPITYTGAKILYFAPKQKRKVRFVLAAKDKVAASLESSIHSATHFVKIRLPKTSKPVVLDTLFCNLDDMTVEPKSGDLFSFNNFVAPKLKLSQNDTAKTFIIADVSGVFSSDSIEKRFYHKGISASFKTKTICLGDTFQPTAVVVSSTHSGAINYQFDINGEVVNQFSPSTAGKFALTLRAQTAFGCTSSYTDTILVNRLADTTIEINSYKLKAAEAYAYKWYLGEDVVGTERELICRKPGFYRVELTTAEGCKSNSGLIDMTVLGIDQEEKISIYPNPFDDLIQINTEGFESALLTDLSSKTILKSQSPLLLTSHLPKGIYILRVKTYSQSFTFKLAKP